MNNSSDRKIYLLDINNDMTDAWHKYFDDKSGVKIINDSFGEFMKNHPEIDGIVSPANSFGLMDGGYDKAIIDYLGWRAQANVLCLLDARYRGYQPVGTCFAVPYGKHVILHTPTMRSPEKILDERVIYDCMYSCLLEADRLKLKNIVIPAFGGCTGGVPYDTIARLMSLAYTHINRDKGETNWDYVIGVVSEMK